MHLRVLNRLTALNNVRKSIITTPLRCISVNQNETELKVESQANDNGINAIPKNLQHQNEYKEFFNKAHYRFIYPEFLPEPDMSRRHQIREILEREDMMARRKQIEIPEFYTGSIMSVTVSDPNAPGCTNRFVGICILREERGLRSYFILRNIIDQQGVEIRYDMYNPCIQKIEVLRLEKRVDEHLVYLRDAYPEYCTFSFDMEAEPRPETGIVPINTIQVKLKDRPWYARWELFKLHGIANMDQISERRKKLALTRGENVTGYLKYDLMQHYRKTINEQDQGVIWDEVHKHHSEVQEIRKKDRKKRLLKKKK